MLSTHPRPFRAFRCSAQVLLVLLAASPLVSFRATAQERAYIPDLFEMRVNVIDVDSGTVEQTIPVDSLPSGVAVSNDGLTVYVSTLASTVAFIDTATASMTHSVDVGAVPYTLALSPDGTTLYAVNNGSNTISVIDTGTASVVDTIPVASGPFAVAFTSDGQKAFVTHESVLFMSVIDTTTLDVTQLPVGYGTRTLIMDPTGSRLYVTSVGGLPIIVINPSSQAIVQTFADPVHAKDLAISPDGATLYVPNDASHTVAAVDAATGLQIGDAVATGFAPWGIDVTGDGSQVYVAHSAGDPITILDAATMTIANTVALGETYAFGDFIAGFAPPAPPEGVNLSTPTAPLTYAGEILATPGAPMTLDNAAGDLNLTLALGYSFSPDETRYARIECPGVVFDDDAEAEYVGGGSASIGALNGLNSGAVHFSITADDASVGADDLLTITGGRSITGTDPIDCTYGLYDFPSQAASGGIHGRVATVSGAYLDFAESTVFAATPFTSVADVEADPSFSTFVARMPTTDDTAGLARLHYGLATPAPLRPDGSPIALADLHATGADGTRIIAEGDFSAAANADGSFTGDALARVYLSGNDTVCSTVGALAASRLSATQAEFPVGDAATDALLCFVPLAGTPIPVADYSASLVAVAAAPLDYAVDDLGPFDAGAITRSGTQLQAPLVQVPEGWLSRLVLTNTGPLDRSYAIAATGETGNLIGTANLTGVVPAHGTVVVDLHDVLVSFSGERRATLDVTVAGPDRQIQGLYQIVNPNTGTLSNHVMVRPATN